MSSQVFELAKSHPWAASFLLLFGALTLAKSIVLEARALLQMFVLPGQSLQRFRKKGSWAVVTGASDGIGKEFAFQLAKAGFNVLLVARKIDVLESIASEIAKKYPGTATRAHSIDFAHATDADFDSLANVIQGLDIGVLVNNVGKSHNMPVYFAETEKDELKDIVTINVMGTLRVTQSVLPGMIQRKGGLVLLIGSFAGSVPSPMLATYSGSKAFLATFASALAEEVRGNGILVEHVNTYFVVSKLSKIRRGSAMVPTVGPYVKSVLSKIGRTGYHQVDSATPYWSHALLEHALYWLGLPWVGISYTHALHKDIRRRALKKAAHDKSK